LVLRWVAGELLASNYALGREAIIPSALVEAIDSLKGPVSVSDLRKRWSFHENVEDFVESLVNEGILTIVGSEADRHEQDIDAVWRWGQPTRWFHFSTQQQEFLGNPEAERVVLAERALDDPPPEAFLSRGSIDILLPREMPSLPGSLENVLENRRTCRQFARKNISLETLSCILYSVWGARKKIKDPPFGEFVLKSSPSGGARHPTEVYAIVRRTTDVEPGLYHYNVSRNGLTRIHNDVSEEVVSRLCRGQEWFKDASVLFLMTGVLPRIMWKYPIDHAYRVLQMDAGHLGQTFHLVCTALGLGPVTTAAIDFKMAETVLQIDGVREVVLYMGATGYPASQ
jgi:SagB-type dehydrogenase family enzyme